MITKYKIIKASGFPDDFEKKINDEILKGWQPWGQPTVSLSSNASVYMQAMVRYSSDPDEWQKLNEEQLGAT
jgi:hypothetical protein